MRLFILSTLAAGFIGSAANAAIIYADVILDYEHSGSEVFADGFGYGGPPDATTVPLANATDESPNTWVSLPTGSYITLGFSSGYVFDGAGDDLFVDEIGNGAEDAELYVSSDYGSTFTYLTLVFGNQTNSLDFSDYSYTGEVNAVKILGLDKGGSSPGFDITGVWGLEGSTVEEPQGPINPIPLPASAFLLIASIGALGSAARGRKKS